MTMAGWVGGGGDDDWGDYCNKEVTTYLLPYHLRQVRGELEKKGVDWKSGKKKVKHPTWLGLGLLGSGFVQNSSPSPEFPASSH